MDTWARAVIQKGSSARWGQLETIEALLGEVEQNPRIMIRIKLPHRHGSALSAHHRVCAVCMNIYIACT
jgi:hypothetical protein